ncbi:hypothetical protein SAKOR_01595 [Staphylococcus aureus subsp. aureus CN1]|nr:hypothetical protein SAKOR_01595 [Staphylococcus aureus subsp. aureus CN1]BAR09113.1 hypothetical protein SAJPND1_01602 [Staphylococcus aureus]BAR11837.1 hypothetical protein SAJPND4_01602 [Staphylococcus aureus]
MRPKQRRVQTLDLFAEVIERKRLSIKALKEETRRVYVYK